MSKPRKPVHAVIFEHNDATAHTRCVRNTNGNYNVTCLDHENGKTVAKTFLLRDEALRCAYTWAGM